MKTFISFNLKLSTKGYPRQSPLVCKGVPSAKITFQLKVYLKNKYLSISIENISER